MSKIKSVLWSIVEFVGGLGFFLIIIMLPLNFISSSVTASSPMLGNIVRILIILAGVGLAVYYYRGARPWAGSGFVVGMILYIAMIRRGD